MTPYRVARLPAQKASPPSERRRGPRTWSEHDLLQAIRDWTNEHGAPPSYLDWDPSRARRMNKPEKAARHSDGNWPTTRIVCDTFGTFNSAIHAAGIAPRRAPGTKPNLEGPHVVLDAIRAWTLRYGEPPRRTDWDPTRARQTDQPWKADRYSEGDWPSMPTVTRHFGGLTAAIDAAGLERAPQHETPSACAARRRRNRLALINTLTPDALDGRQLDAAIARMTTARKEKDPEDLEDALMRLAACAFGLAHVVHGRRRSKAS